MGAKVVCRVTLLYHFYESAGINVLLLMVAWLCKKQNGVFGQRQLEYKFGTVPATKVQSKHVMASVIPGAMSNDRYISDIDLYRL